MRPHIYFLYYFKLELILGLGSELELKPGFRLELELF